MTEELDDEALKNSGANPEEIAAYKIRRSRRTLQKLTDFYAKEGIPEQAVGEIIVTVDGPYKLHKNGVSKVGTGEFRAIKKEQEERRLAAELDEKPLYHASQAWGSAVRGVPVMGPWIDKGAKHAGAALGSMLPGGGTYQENLGQLNREEETYKKYHPNRELAGNLVGGIASTAPLAGASMAAKGAGLMYGRAAGLGAADFASRNIAKDPGNIDPISLGIDTATGAGLGVLGQGVASGIGTAVNRFFPGLSNKLPGMSAHGTRNALKGVTPENLARSQSRMGKNQILAEVISGGPRKAASAAQHPTGLGKLSRAIEPRVGQIGADAKNLTARALGVPKRQATDVTAIKRVADKMKERATKKLIAGKAGAPIEIDTKVARFFTADEMSKIPASDKAYLADLKKRLLAKELHSAAEVSDIITEISEAMKTREPQTRTFLGKLLDGDKLGDGIRRAVKKNTGIAKYGERIAKANQVREGGLMRNAGPKELAQKGSKELELGKTMGVRDRVLKGTLSKNNSDAKAVVKATRPQKTAEEFARGADDLRGQAKKLGQLPLSKKAQADPNISGHVTNTRYINVGSKEGFFRDVGRAIRDGATKATRERDLIALADLLSKTKKNVNWRAMGAAVRGQGVKSKADAAGIMAAAGLSPAEKEWMMQKIEGRR